MKGLDEKLRPGDVLLTRIGAGSIAKVGAGLARARLNHREVRNPSLSAITTLGLGGTCSLELTVSSRDDLAAMDDRIRELGLPVYVVGRGSNIFGLDSSHEAVLVRPAFTDRAGSSRG